MRIGNIEIPRGAVLAPMAGVTCVPFRRLCIELGAALTVTEMISADALLRSAVRHRERIEKAPGERILAGQILARSPEQFAEAARAIVDMGADIVDLNFGCPSRKVIKTGGGAAFAKDPDRIAASVRAVVGAVDVPVTVKLRAGWKKGHATAPEAARLAEREGACAVFIHGRYRDQVHSGPVDLEVIKSVKQSVSVPVVGNGGIRKLEDAGRMLSESGCDMIMIGQGATTNPWIFSAVQSALKPGGARTQKVTDPERISTVKKLFDYYVEWAGEKRACLEIRKYAAWLVRGIPGAAGFRRNLGRVTSQAVLDEMLEGFLITS